MRWILACGGPPITKVPIPGAKRMWRKPISGKIDQQRRAICECRIWCKGDKWISNGDIIDQSDRAVATLKIGDGETHRIGSRSSVGMRWAECTRRTVVSKIPKVGKPGATRGIGKRQGIIGTINTIHTVCGS